MSSYEKLIQLFNNHYDIEKIIQPENDFIRYINNKIDSVDFENFFDVSKQRDLSLKFHWGHNHTFSSTFKIEGRMGNRHLNIISQFVDKFSMPFDLKNKKVLDIGVWTGGTSLLLVAMGAEVIAIEEVSKYADMVNYLSYSFGIQDLLKCYSLSLYEALPMYCDYFDYVLYSGVIYHVTDPLLSLRQVFTSLKNGGEVFIETYGINSSESVCKYEGPNIYSSGNEDLLNRTGWNYFIPSTKCLERWCYDVGFQSVYIGDLNKHRVLGKAKRVKFLDFCRAGISNRFIR